MGDTFRLVWGPPVIDGHISLRIGVLKRYQTKYCYVTANAELLYFQTLQSDPREPSGKLVLHQPNVKTAVSKNKKKKGRFDIVIGKKRHEFKTDDKYEANSVDSWVEALEKVI